MDFFLQEILENEEVGSLLSTKGDMADRGWQIAKKIAAGDALPEIEPGLLQVYVLAYLADYALEKNSARGISRQITIDTLKDINIWLNNYRNRYGKPGLEQFFWLVLHYRGELFRLGRLQYEIQEAPAALPGEKYVLATHVPQGEPLREQDCLDSFSLAKDFFHQYFPEKPVSYFTCHSWLLCPHLSDVLEEESNIVRFMRLWHPYSFGLDHSAQAIQRVFGFDVNWENLSNAPEVTRLQKRMKAYLLSGGDLSACVGWRKI